MAKESLVNLSKPSNVLVLIDNEQPIITTKLASPSSGSKNENIAPQQLTKQYCDHLFSAIQNYLTYFLNQNFTIYSTTLDELNRRAWFNTTRLLIVVHGKEVDDQEYLNFSKNSILKEFHIETNNVLIIDRLLLAKSTNVEQFEFNDDLLRNKVLKKLGNELELCASPGFTLPECTTHYVYSTEIDLSNRLFDHLRDRFKLKAEIVDQNSMDKVQKYDFKRYLDHLAVKNKLGRNVIFSEVTESTQPIAESAPHIDGLIVIADEQTKGKGRGQNQWLSPNGSISFTYAVFVPMDSIMFRSLGFFQHMNALAVLLSIKKLSQIENLDLKIKWPNDIYYKSKHKIVGILTNSHFEGNSAKFFIGTGINLKNRKPTYSLQNIIEEHTNEKSRFNISKEELIAEILNQVNYLINLMNSQGKQKVVELYYENWMLTDKTIKLDNGNLAHVLGLDEDGFLRVNIQDDGQIVSLLPDGNRWDILENLCINPSTV